MTEIDPRQLYRWCQVPYTRLERHPELKIPFRLKNPARWRGLRDSMAGPRL